MTSGCLATALLPSPASAEFLSPPPRKLPPTPKLKPQELGLKGLLPLQLQLQYQSQPQKPLQLQLQLQLQSASSAGISNHPVLIDVQDCREGDSVLFSFGIAEQCSRHREILSYLMSGSESSSADFSQLSHLMGFLPYTVSPPPCNYMHHHNININMAHFLQTISPTSLLTVDPTGRILFTGTPSEMRDLLSILAEFNIPPHMHPHPHAGASKVSLLVPYFDRTRGRAKAATQLSALNFPIETIAPSKCKGTKSKSPQKKRQKKNTTYNRDIFQKNYFHACESLLSLLLDKSSTSTSSGGGIAESILSLKKLGPEIAHILTSFAIGIAGTGLAVLFSVVCKMPSPGTRVPLSANRFFNTGFGLGLFWLSWAVNGLRDTIVQLFKAANKLETKDEEMALKVERSLKGVLFRAGMLVALAALRFA